MRVSDDFHEDDLPRRTRRPNRPERSRRGRTTEDERRLLALRRDGVDDPAPVGDRWSTWGDGERGPTPHPAWLITELAAVDEELGVVKTGKEADVHLVRRSVPDTGRDCLLAAKRYRSGDHRLFHRDSGYLEGRRTRRSRETRALGNRSAFGRNLLAERWAAAEFAALSRLWELGAPVPYPAQRVGTELLVEFIGDAEGVAAPRLAGLRPDPDTLVALWERLSDALTLMARAGLTHGDLSPFNILVDGDRLVLIDLPQVVDLVANPRGVEFLHRDVRNVTDWFTARGLPRELADPDQVSALLTEEAGLW